MKSLFLTCIVLTCCLCIPTSATALDSLCATVKIEIQQDLTLERQAFDAHMRINNGLSTITLENVNINVWFKDKDGNAVLATSDPADTNAQFFIRLDRMENISNVSGAGRVDPSSMADIHWLIIPAMGASNSDAAGTMYYVGATLSYTMGGEQKETSVTPDYIYVKPLPSLTLDYFLPKDVYGDDPFTQLIEPPVPFALGVRVKNTGYGVARNVKIDSALPKITVNDQGLLVGFNINGSEVNGSPATNSLLAQFGDIAPNSSSVARWLMSCSLSGRFIEFTATYSHSDELGGELTSLLQGVNTHLLIKDVVVDIPGRDGIADFLAKDEANINLYESQNTDSSVQDLSGSSVFEAAGQTNTYTLTLSSGQGFIYVKCTDPYAGTKEISEVMRSDGKFIRKENAWLSKSRNEAHEWECFFNLFDHTDAPVYTVVFQDPPAVAHAPVMQFIPDRSKGETEHLSFIVESTDADNTIPALAISRLPVGATFTDRGDGTGMFDWTPAEGQSGRYELIFTASDGTLKDTKRCTVTIYAAWDKDGDGMADAWEMQYFGTLARDGTGDVDNDGSTDLNEFLSGTNPLTGHPPTEPVILFPVDGCEVSSLRPEFNVINSTDPEGNDIAYDFELYADSGMREQVSAESGVIETPVETGWTCSSDLCDHKNYYWRVRATDGGEYSQWSYGSFFVNSANEAPGLCVVSYPSDNTEVATASTTLAVSNAVDPDNDGVTYTFEVFADSATSVPVASITGVPAGAGGITRWNTVPVLTDTVRYYWRAIAADEHGATQSTTLASFIVNTANHASSSPVVSQPGNGVEVDSDTITIAIQNTPDQDNDTVTYCIELDTVSSFNSSAKQAFANVAQSLNETTYVVAGLADDIRYYLRVKAYDGKAESAWVTSTFFVNTANNDPSMVTCRYPGNRTWARCLSPALAVDPAQDKDGDAVAYCYEVYSDSGLAHRVCEAASAGMQWDIPVSLDVHAWYYWRCRTQDEHGAYGAWSDPCGFYVTGSETNVPPQITLIKPVELLELSTGTVLIEWQDSDPDSNAAISIFYSSAAAGGDAVMIANGISEDGDEVNDTYRWDISLTPDGTYYVYARISDTLASAVSYAPAAVIIDRTAPSVTATPAGGVYFSAQDVVLSAGESADICYTLDGSTPSLSSSVYSAPLHIAGAAVLKTLARDHAGNISTVRTDAYSIVPETATCLSLTDIPAWTAERIQSWTWTAPAGLPAFQGYVYRLDDGPEVLTGGTSYISPSLADGPHTFSVRIRFSSAPVVLGSVVTDSFNVDATAPVLTGVVLNNNDMAADNPQVNVTLSHNGDGAGGGIARFEAGIDGGEWAVFDGSNLSLPAVYGKHTVSVRCVDTAGLLSQTRSDSIVFAPVVNGVSGTAIDGSLVTLENLMSGECQSVSAPGGAFSFSGIPSGVYGLRAALENAVGSLQERISLYDGAVKNVGAISVVSYTNGIEGSVNPSVAGMSIALCRNFGQGYYFCVKETTTTPGGYFTLSDIEPGQYVLRALAAPGSSYAGERTVTLPASGLVSSTIELQQCAAVNGTSTRPGQSIRMVGDTGRGYIAITGDDGKFSINAASGTYIVAARDNFYYAEPAGVVVIDSSVSCTLNAYSLGISTLCSVTQGNLITGDTETGVHKSLQVFHVASGTGALNVPYLVPASDEVTSPGTNTQFTMYGGPLDSKESDLCCVADDAARDIHAVSLAAYTTSGTGVYEVTSAGGKINGTVRLHGIDAVAKALVVLIDGAGKPIGMCEGGTDGGYFFKNIPAGNDMKLCAAAPGIPGISESEPFTLSAGQVLSGKDLAVGATAQLSITGYPASFLASQSIPVNISWAHVPSDSVYRLLLRLENTTAGNAIEGEQCKDNFASSGSDTLNLDIHADAAAGTAYRLSLYCVPKATGTGIMVAQYHTPADLTVNVDAAAPVLTIPQNVTIEAYSAQGATVTLTATVVDDHDPDPLVTDNAPSVFMLGVTTVTFVSVDSSGNTAMLSMTVTVVDTTLPALSVPENVTVFSTSSVTQISIGQASATDIFQVTIDNDAPEDGFSAGVTTVTWTATDSNGNAVQATQRVTVHAVNGDNVTVYLLNSDGEGISGAVVQYVDYCWTTMGTTGSDGSVSIPKPQGKTDLQVMVTYAQSDKQITQNIITNPVIIFNTVKAVVALKDAHGTGISGGEVTYSGAQWTTIGTTNSSGEVTKELLPGSYTFTMSYAWAQKNIVQDISTNTVVLFQTVTTTVTLKDSSGNGISGGEVMYVGSQWSTFGTTNSSGVVTKELLPASYMFEMSYFGANKDITQNIGDNGTVMFQTIQTTLRLKDTQGNGISGGSASYAGSQWRSIGSTDSSGDVMAEILPGTYTFYMSYSGINKNINQSNATNAIVLFDNW